MRVRSFKNRLLILIVTLMALAQGVTIVLALADLSQRVQDESARQLLASRVLLDQLLTNRATQLDSASRVLVADFAFREAVATNDHDTILSALTNHAGRINADMAVIYDVEGQPIANTLESLGTAVGRLSLPEDLTTDALTPVYAVIDQRAYELVFAPVRAPQVIGWVALGFRLDAALAELLKKQSGSDVSFVVQGGGAQQVVVSTLPATVLKSPDMGMSDGAPDGDGVPRGMLLNDQEYLTLRVPLDTQNGRIDLVVQRSLDEAMQQYRQMRLALLLIGGAALLGAIVVAWLTGRSAIRPLSKLVAAAQRVEAGDYQRGIDVSGGEEFEQLAQTFNTMQLGIREREARIVQQANHDALTGLPNRTALRNALRQQASMPTLSVALLDIQRFRDINASLGHSMGDQLLCALAEYLKNSCGSAVQIARVGADQFAVAMPLHDSQMMHRMLLLSEELQQGLPVADLRININLLVGISEWRAPRVAVDDWLRQADVALLEAKEHGSAITTYQASHDAEHRRRIMLVSELRRAIAEGSLSLMYQPLVQMTNRDPVSFEALVRWTHPTLGPISPAEFIPLAERASVVGDLTRWVLGAAITQLGQWRKQGFETEVAINLSAADMTDPALVPNLLALLREHDVPTRQLILEVTESAIMNDPQLAAQAMQQLRSLGIRFAIDDFGTGHSSLAQLHALPVDELKIDRAFIMNVDTSASNAAIVQATTELGHSLGLKVVAEGVETPEVWSALLRLGCDLVQGYFISRPMPAAAVVEWTRNQRMNLSQVIHDAAQDGTLSDIRSRFPG